jgi:hypothetical protein
MIPEMTATTIEAADIMVIIAPRITSAGTTATIPPAFILWTPHISITTNVNTGKKVITGIPGKITAVNTVPKNRPIPKSTSHRTACGPAVEILTVALVSPPGAEVKWVGAIRGGVHTAFVVKP